ncbi:MAG: thioesterase superfamily protein [Anaerolineaceae bacterium]|nr:MAG: thioesterase superfamily protein [Anaerolineaceae bacterium]
MTEPLSPKPMRASHIQLAQLMMPEHANLQGNVHGGWIMKLVDEAGALASTRHAGRRVVTVAIDQMVFRQPIRIGDLIILDAEVTYVGRTSIEVEVQVIAENPISGQRTHTNAAYLVYVAIGEDGKPAPVPPLVAENPAEKARMEAARQRQEQRLAEKKAGEHR